MVPLILMRSHHYDEHVRISFAKLRECSSRFKPFLLLDTSRGDLTPDIPTLKFRGERLQELGLELYPEKRWAWFAGDYALYCALLAKPECSHCFMVDYDARVNFSVDDLMSRVAAERVDLVAPYAGFENANWMWTSAGRHWFDRVVGCFFPVVVLSRRLILKCLETRIAHSKAVPTDKSDKARFLRQNWVNCEAFVPSVALANGYSMVDIQKLVPKWSYAYLSDLDVMHWDMPDIAEVPCAHPVFLKHDLPLHIHRKLDSLPDGETRTSFVNRVNDRLKTDEALWAEIVAVNPELTATVPIEDAAVHSARNLGRANTLVNALSDQGIVAVSDIYSVADLAVINTAMDPIFASKAHEARSYVRPDEMLDAGIFHRVLSRKMKDVIFSIVPDPVLYHFHAYEIAANSPTAHILGERLGGWHRDTDSQFFEDRLTHISIFVYLTDVGELDGPFELSPHSPDKLLRSASPVISMTGPGGTSFVWHRSYYHRAAPNSGPRRRRLLKISVQPNCFTSHHLGNEFFQRVRAEVPAGNVETDLLLGRYQGRRAPQLYPTTPIRFFVLQSGKSVNLSDDLLAALNRDGEAAAGGQPVAYD